MDSVGSGGEVTIARREHETLVQRHGQPDTLETLGLQPLLVRVGVGALEILAPTEVPPAGAEVLGSLLELGEHVLAPQPQDIIHGVPVL